MTPKKNIQKNILCSNSGQGIVEYILLLVIMVGIIGGIAKQFNKEFREYTDQWFGPEGYLECLLIMGELPSLGADSAASCVEKMPHYKHNALGGGYVGSGGGSGSDSDGSRGRGRGGKSSSSGADKDKTGEEDSANAASSGKDGDGSGRRRGGGIVEGPHKNKKRFTVGAMDGGDGAGEGNKKSIAGKDNLRKRGFRSLKTADLLSGGSGGKQIIIIDSPYIQFAEKGKKKETEASRIVASGDGMGSIAQSKKLVIKSVKKEIVLAEDKTDFSFGRLIRIALILIIIIAIALFLGGQILQISKSMEK